MRLSSILTKNIQKFYHIDMTTRAMNLIFIALIADKFFDFFTRSLRNRTNNNDHNRVKYD